MNKSKKLLLWVFKIIVFVVLALLLYLQLKKYPVSQILILKWNTERIWALLCCFMIMPLNWSIEALKWSYINRSHAESIPFSKSLASVIFGACAGFLSPGRWAEPLARAYYVGKGNRIERTYWNFTGIIAQWLVTIFAGLLAISVSQTQIFKDSNLHLFSYFFLLILLIIYMYHDWISRRIFRLKWVNNLLKLEEAKLKVSKINKAVILCYTCLRFCVYSFQYLLMLKAFTPESNTVDVLMRVFMLFLFQSFSIFPGLLDVGFKGNIALLVFKGSLISPLDLLFVVLFIWFINLFIPAIIGYAFFYHRIRDFMKTSIQ